MRVFWFFLLCLANAILSFAYANVQDNHSLASIIVFRYFIVGGLLLSVQFTLHLIIALAENRDSAVRRLSVILMACCVATVFFAANGTHVAVKNDSANTISYVLERKWTSYAESAYVFLASALALYVLWRRWKTAGYKRMRLQAATCAVAVALLSLSTQMAVIMPVVGVTTPPLCAVFTYFFILFIWKMSKRYETYNITFGNLAELIFADVDLPILVTDADDRIILANKTTRSFFGLDETDINHAEVGRLFSAGYPPETSASDASSGNAAFEAKALDGTHDVLVEMAKHFDDYGELLCSIYMIRDITESKRMIQRLNDSILEAEIANKAKSSFLANMSHEIRTPMNAIVGMAEIALRNDLPTELAANINSIRSAGLGLVTIINDILDFSKIESGKMEIVKSEYILTSVIVDIVNMFAIKMANSDVMLLVDVDPRIPMHLVGDEIRIKQVLVNIVGNAVKFTQKGYVRLEIGGSFEGDADTYSLTFKVIDTGSGIREEDLPKLFGMFSQVDTKKNRNIVGTGLGLSIARNLCQMMDGDIEVESVYGAGSTFNIHIKQQVRRDNAPLTYVEKPYAKFVAVYEPNESLRQSFERMLSNLDVPHRVFPEAADFASALAEGRATHAALRADLLDAEIEKSLRDAQDGTKPILVTNIYDKPRIDIHCSEVYLPLYAFQMADILNNRESKIVAKDRAADYAVTPIPGAKVLIVDDTYVNLQVAQGLLAPYGMDVHTASSGMEAIAMVQKTDYDMVFMDHMMPVMDGVEATRAIRAMGGKYGELAVIALTANAIAGAKEMFLREGFNDFLAKPIELSKLKGIVKKWIAPKHAAPPEARDRITEAADAERVEQAEGDLIDYRRGLGFLGGNPGLYFNVLKTYYLDLPNKKDTLGQSLADGELNLYAITAHSLKSTSISMGVRIVPELAYALEKAGKQGDLEYVASHHGELLARIAELEREIGRRFGGRIGVADENGGRGKKSADKTATKDRISDGLLAELMEAVDFCDPKRSAATLDEIRTETYPAETEDFLGRLGRAVEQSNFMEAENLLQAFIGRNESHG